MTIFILLVVGALFILAAVKVEMGAPFRVLLGVVGGLIILAAGSALLPSSAPEQAASSSQAASPPPQSSQPVQQPAAPQPSYGVGDLVDLGGADFGVAGGKMIEKDGSPYLALQIVVRNTEGAAMYSFSTVSLSVSDATGLSTDSDTISVIENGLPYLDTSSVPEGQTTAGWVAFKVPEVTDDLVLHVQPLDVTASEIPVSLAGVLAASASSPAAQLFSPGLKAAADAEDRSSVTMDEYKQVKEGMSLAQVEDVIGFAGEESSSSGGYVIYSWANSDGGNMMVTFYNNRVQSKAQAGL